MRPIEYPFVPVPPLAAEYEVFKYRKVPYVRDGSYDDSMRRELRFDVPDQAVGIDEVFEYVVKNNAIEIPVRQFFHVFVDDADKHLVKLFLRFSAGFVVKLDATDFAAPAGFQLEAERPIPAADLDDGFGGFRDIFHDFRSQTGIIAVHL
jgi:hypothetical protein